MTPVSAHVLLTHYRFDARPKLADTKPNPKVQVHAAPRNIWNVQYIYSSITKAATDPEYEQGAEEKAAS